MRTSGIIFTAKKHKPLIAVFASFLIGISIISFTFFRFGTPHQTANADGYSNYRNQNNYQNNNAVSIQNFQFNPQQMIVIVGTTVTWTNNETNMQHTVTSDDGLFDSGALQPGQSFSLMFNTPGTYMYHCNIHPFMHGTIRVISTGQNYNMNPYANQPPNMYPMGNFPRHHHQMYFPMNNGYPQSMNQYPNQYSQPPNDITPTPPELPQPMQQMQGVPGMQQTQSQNQVNNNNQSVNIQIGPPQ